MNLSISLPLELAMEFNGPPSLELTTESDSLSSKESATDSAVSQSPPSSESAYNANSGIEISHGGVPPNLVPDHKMDTNKDSITRV